MRTGFQRPSGSLYAFSVVLGHPRSRVPLKCHPGGASGDGAEGVGRDAAMQASSSLWLSAQRESEHFTAPVRAFKPCTARKGLRAATVF